MTVFVVELKLMSLHENSILFTDPGDVSHVNLLISDYCVCPPTREILKKDRGYLMKKGSGKSFTRFSVLGKKIIYTDIYIYIHFFYFYELEAF